MASSTKLASGEPDRRTGLGWSLWPVASALPWLLPTHSEPWTTFYGEWLMAAVLVPIGIWALLKLRHRWTLDPVAAGFLLGAIVPILQALAGMFGLPREASLVSMYLTAFAITLMVARHAEEGDPSRLTDALFAGLAIAAILSTGIALYQWFGQEQLGVLLAPVLPGARPVANVGQPNNLATLLVWGLVAVWWAHTRRHIGGYGATLAAAFLLMGLALTQSRTGLLAVGVLVAGAYLGRRLLGTLAQVKVWLALLLWWVVLVAALEPISRVLLLESTRSVVDPAAPRERMAILRMVLEAIVQHPWLGYGWNQIVPAHVGLADQFPLHQTVGHAHNFVLDLVLWNGLPLASLMLAGLCLWLWGALRAVRTAEQVLLMLGLAVFVLHAMLELPHVIATFLLPVAVMMGTLSAHQRIATLWNVPRIAIVAGVLLHATVLTVMFCEYRGIESRAMSARLRAARIGNEPPRPEPEVYVLRSLQDALVTLASEPRRGMSTGELEHLRRTVVRYPNQGALFRYALANALNGRPDEASWALHVLCDLNSVAMCRAAAEGWVQVAADGNPEIAVVSVPSAERPLLRP